MQDDNALRPSSEASSAPPEAEVSSTQVVKNAENPQPMTETVLGYGNCSMAWPQQWQQEQCVKHQVWGLSKDVLCQLSSCHVNIQSIPDLSVKEEKDNFETQFTKKPWLTYFLVFQPNRSVTQNNRSVSLQKGPYSLISQQALTSKKLTH